LTAISSCLVKRINNATLFLFLKLGIRRGLLLLNWECDQRDSTVNCSIPDNHHGVMVKTSESHKFQQKRIYFSSLYVLTMTGCGQFLHNKSSELTAYDYSGKNLDSSLDCVNLMK